MSKRPVRRTRLLLLILLWVWAGLVFMIVDLFWSVREFDPIRPRAEIYRAMRIAAHQMVGEPYEGIDSDHLGALPPRSPGDTGAERAGLVMLAGSVHRADGKAASGARVTAIARSLGAGDSTTVAGDGLFTLWVEAGELYDLEAALDGHAPTVRRNVLAPSREVLVLDEGLRVSGKVVDEDGQAVEGVLLWLVTLRAEDPDPAQRPPPGSELEARTDAAGRFDFEHVAKPVAPQESLRLITAGGPVWVGGTTAVPSHGRVEVRVERAHPVQVWGTIRDAGSGRPVAGAEIEIPPFGSIRAGGNGAFRMGSLQPGQVWARVGAEGYAWLEQSLFVDEAGSKCNLELTPLTTIEGRIVDRDRNAIGEARVRWTDATGAIRERIADESGQFLMDGISSDGVARIRVEAPGFAPVQFRATPEQSPVVVTMEQGACLEGEILAADGTPCEAATVRLLPGLGRKPGAPPAPEMPASACRSTRTDETGCYRFEDLPAGGTCVVAVPDDRAFAPVAVRAAGIAGELALVPPMRIGPASPRVVRLLDERGRSLPGVTVRVTGKLGAYLGVTGPDGRCELWAASGFGENIQLTHPDYADRKLWVGARDKLPSEIRLARRAAVPQGTR